MSMIVMMRGLSGVRVLLVLRVWLLLACVELCMISDRHEFEVCDSTVSRVVYDLCE